MDVSGIFPALTTPFSSDGSISIADLKHNIQMYNRVGLAGYVVMGSTGESVLLSKSEMEAVLVAVKETASRDKKLIAGTGAESTAETIERTKRAAELGLVTRVVADQELLATANETARKLAEKPPAALQACKRLIRSSTRELLERAVKLENEEFATRVRSAESKEAFTAFIEKRKPNFDAVSQPKAHAA